jgi:ArsR family transcriptional regulator
MKCAFNKKKVQNWANIFKCLGHDKRLEIIFGLLNEECSVGEIQSRLEISQSSLSQHLRILRDAGILKSVKEGNRVIYSLENEEIKKLLENVDLY